VIYIEQQNYNAQLGAYQHNFFKRLTPS